MSEIRANTISDAAGTGPVTLTGQSAAKAYVYAATDATLLKSFNVSSGTDNGTGDYTFSFTNSFDSANYAHLATAFTSAGRAAGDGATGKAASAMKTLCFALTGAAADNQTSNSAFGDLA